MNISTADTAIVITDPQNDVLKTDGPVWSLVGEALETNRTIENLGRLIDGASQNGFSVFVSPHYNFESDHQWKFGGPIENMMHEGRMFARTSPLSVDGFAGSGADWLDVLEPKINNGTTVVTSPHKMFGAASNDLVLQLRKRGISKVILGGMLANLCVESHLRDLLENGFEVVVVKDAVAAPNHPELGDGNQSAATNYNFLANAVWTTDQVVEALSLA